MIEENVIIPNIEDDKKLSEENEEIITKNEVTEEKLKDEENVTEEKPLEKIDFTDDEYRIHQGRIECINVTKCMEMSLPVQLKYNNLISDIAYINILANNHKVLGYFIKYTYKSIKLENYEKCLEKAKEIKEDLVGKISDAICNESGELTIKPDYEEGELNNEN